MVNDRVRPEGVGNLLGAPGRSGCIGCYDNIREGQGAEIPRRACTLGFNHK